jgi:hypothetical protein
VIRRISIEGFKSFGQASVELGELNILIGSNASGKSNFLEALQVLQGIAGGLPVKDVFDGSSKSSSQAAWAPIRGGSQNAATRQGNGLPRVVDRIHLSADLITNGESASYSLVFFEPPHFLRREELYSNGKKIFEIRNTGQIATYYPDGQSQPIELAVDPLRAALGQLPLFPQCQDHHVKLIRECIRDLSDMQHLDPQPSVLRRYSEHATVTRMGDSGENFAALVNAIEDKDSYLRWLRLAVAEFQRIEIMKGALGEPLFALEQQNRLFAAPQLSDGTLRFAALTAAFFQPSMPRVLLIEEIETAIHPSRLNALIDLIKSQSVRCGTQVFASTHSPVVLGWLQEKDYAHVLLFQLDGETGESRVSPLSALPGFLELVRKQSIADMYAEGWMEAVS